MGRVHGCIQQLSLIHISGIEGEEGDAGNEYASGDKLGLKLPGLQQELLEAVAAVGKPIVLTVLAGSALDLSRCV